MNSKRRGSRQFVLGFQSCLLFLVFGNCFASAQTVHTISAGNGTLSYTVTTTYPVCTPNVGPPKTYTKNVFSGFSYTLSGVTTPLSGDDITYQDPNGAPCPPTSNPPVTFTLPGEEILFTPSLLGGGGTANVSGLLYPKYYITSILYAPPGNKSTVSYTNSTTYATTGSTGANFQEGTSSTFSESFGFMGIGGTESDTYGTATAEGVTYAFTTSISQGSIFGIDSVSTNPNTVSHNQDAFVLWLNPAISILQTGSTDAYTYGMGTQLQTAGDPDPGAPEGTDQMTITAEVLQPSSTNGGLTTVPPAYLNPQIALKNIGRASQHLCQCEYERISGQSVFPTGSVRMCAE
jgi:hypothetical protein